MLVYVTKEVLMIWYANKKNRLNLHIPQGSIFVHIEYINMCSNYKQNLLK